MVRVNIELTKECVISDVSFSEAFSRLTQSAVSTSKTDTSEVVYSLIILILIQSTKSSSNSSWREKLTNLFVKTLISYLPGSVSMCSHQMTNGAPHSHFHQVMHQLLKSNLETIVICLVLRLILIKEQMNHTT